ncbi:MAG: aminotransferase class III-fold pyridoxal phosphate-dependent enzyme [Desulfovibrionaceae bacterium]|nr:aminotransferase class III-fold pyridoxal phosphate-dependent enzyme [Desulfovibrionaceae bacterium]MBF0512677.1 aminotransferase class III-fold pyridoxal phosphate-dependent enzyme [Desulfovibrionaceae bacterium]
MMAPGVWPAYFSKAKGTRVWDLDGNAYTDMSILGVGAVILGYADDEVDDAVVAAVRNGVATSLNCPEEVALAELLTTMHPWADMVRYARSGGEAMAMAVRIARAATGRDTVLFSGYHGWMDWYLAANLDGDALDGQLLPGLAPNGVPKGLAGTAIPFFFNDIAALHEKIAGREREIAAIVVEPARGEEAPRQYLDSLVATAGRIGATLIFDEITSAFRMNAGGIHLRYGVAPDMAVFAKSMANGYAMAAVIGRREVMEAAQTTFISSTNWTERVGPAAALATIGKYVRENAAEHICAIGRAVQTLWRGAADRHGLSVRVSGLPSLCHLDFPGEYSRERATFFTIAMLARGFLGYRQFKPCLAHALDDVSAYGQAVDEVFAAMAATDPAALLSTPVAHAGFVRLTPE